MKRFLNILKTIAIIRWEYRKDFCILKRAIKLGEKMFFTKKIAWIEDNNFSKIIVLNLSKNFQTLKAVCILCQNGYGQDAIVNLRAMFENYIDFKYMEADKSRTQAYMEFDYYEKIKSIRVIENVKSIQADKEKLQAKKKELEIEWQKIKYRFTIKNKNGTESICKRWSCKDLRTMAIELGLGDSYDILYRHASGYVHSASGIAGEYVLGRDKKSNSIVTEIGPSHNSIREVLATSTSIFIDMLSIANKEHNLEFDEELKKISDEWKKGKVKKKNE